MKKFLLSTSLLMIALLMSNKLGAQFTFESFETFNRVLLINYVESADQEVKKEVISLFKGLRKKIDGLEWVHVAELSKSSQSFEQAITLTFDSKAGLESYEAHPDHLRIMKISPAIVEDSESYEFWEKM